MGKTDRRRSYQITRFAYDSGDQVHGGQLVRGSVDQEALDLKVLSLRLDGPRGSYLYIGNVGAGETGVLRFIFAGDAGTPLVHFRSGADPAVTLGPTGPGGRPPVRIYQDRMEIDTEVLMANNIARTFLAKGRLELTTMNRSYDEANEGILLQVTHGIESKLGGRRSIFWDAAAGNFKVGEHGHIILDPDGLAIEVDADAVPEYKGVRWRAQGSHLADKRIGLLYADGSGNSIAMSALVFGIPQHPVGSLRLAATGYGPGLMSQVQVVSGPPGAQGESDYGITLSPQMGYPVRVFGNLQTLMGYMLAGMHPDAPGSYMPIIGRLCTKAISWVPTADDMAGMRYGEMLIADLGGEAHLYVKVPSGVYRFSSGEKVG